jgi:transposase
VGARLGNLSNKLIDEIDRKLLREEGKNIRIETDKGYLICSFSSTRYRKDKYEMGKQIEKAKQVINHPSKGKRLKFVTTKDENRELNEKLIEKTTKLLGIKGYYTNLEESVASNELVIKHYHELYKIEQAFRISKHDLQTRPIFHYKEEPIKLHILICFIALVISKHRKFIEESKKIADGKILDKITQKVSLIKAEPTTKMIDVLEKIYKTH